MRWVGIILVVFICALLLITPMYMIKNKKSKGLMHSSEQDNGRTSEVSPE